MNVVGSRSIVVVVACVLACAVVAVLAARAPAIVPPRDCGRMTVKHRPYVIKADQLRCRTARSYASHYLSHHIRPRGYRCRDYGGETRLKFRCSRRVQVFFAIRR